MVKLRNTYLFGFVTLLLAVGAVLIASNQNISDNQQPAAQPENGSSKLEDIREFDSISIQAMQEREYIGNNLVLGQVLDDNQFYTKHYITYNSNGLTISGIMNIPKTEKPSSGYPVLILNHGFIDPAVYTNGRGLRREQDYLARQGYVVLHSDYRNHAQSDKDENVDLQFRLGYAEDVINAIFAVKNSNLDFVDKNNFGMLGHSMGGGVAWNVMVIKPDLVKAYVQFAPVSTNARDNFERWIVRRPQTANQILQKHGDWETNPEFWADLSPENFFERIQSPVLLHHGTADASVPLAWSDSAASALEQIGKNVTYYVYENQPHEFTSDWGLVMRRTTEFFNQYLK